MYSTHPSQMQAPVSAVEARLARYEALRAQLSPVGTRPVEAPQPVSPPDIAPLRNTTGTARAKLLAWLRSGRLLILACIAAAMLIALAAASTLPSRFTAHADIALGTAHSDTSAPVENQIPEIEGKIRVLTSTNVLGRAVEALDLHTDPEFTASPLFDALRLWRSDMGTPDLHAAALHALRERVGARREGNSAIVRLSVWSDDPQKSVAISEAIVAAFEDEVRQINSAAAQATADSLAQRLGELRARADAAEAAVEAFRREHGLQAPARLPEGQFNEHLIAARAALIVAETRHADLRAARAEGGAGAAALNSELLAGLRGRYLDLRRELDAAEATFGPLHPTITTLRPQVQAVERELNTELDRMLRMAASEVEQAQALVDRLTGDAGGTSAASDEAVQIRLRDLQREAEAQAALYGAYLARAADIAEQSQLGATTVRVISPAILPRSPSWPPSLPLLLASGAATGLAMGMALAILRGALREIGPRPGAHSTARRSKRGSAPHKTNVFLVR